MYEKCKNITVPTTASAQVKNLQVGPKDKLSPAASEHIIGFQYESFATFLKMLIMFKVVSFDAEWREVYLGYVRKDVFTGLENDNCSYFAYCLIIIPF